jgi:competence protein ComEC
MRRFHFLNVKEGDCNIIQHGSGRVSVVDISNARQIQPQTTADTITALLKSLEEAERVRGNFGQKDYPVNPIQYMRDHGISDVHRLIITHPDMDHMDGLKDFCEAFPPTNFWDTDNTCEKEDWGGQSRYREEDWRYYEKLRDGLLNSGPKRLVLHAGARGQFYNDAPAGDHGDGLTILAPTPQLVADANACDDHNDASYVLMYRTTNAGRIIMAGDSHDATWEHILEKFGSEVADVELLIAPHHGRHSDRSFDFLDVLRPKLTLFGNAPSEHLAYDAWNRRGLQVITNNQAGCVLVDMDGTRMNVYVTNQTYAEKMLSGTTYSQEHRGYYIGFITANASESV